MAVAADLTVEQVSWELDGIAMYGTLTHPAGEGPFPGVVFVAGSGPTDRDWNSPLIPGTNGSAAQLAESLAQRGYLSLRYDKRASGPHIQENMQRLAGKVSMRGHAEELAGAVGLLAGRPEAMPGRIFALASSEGCIHALNYQLGAPATPLAGLVLTGAPARPISAVVHSQIAAQLAALPDGATLLAIYEDAVAAFAAGQPVPLDERLPQGAIMLLQGLSAPVNLPFSRELWVTDPAALLAATAAPALIVIGKKDIQVDWHVDGMVFESLASRLPTISIVYPEHANHVLKHEPRPREQLGPAEVMASYSAAGVAIDPEALAAIVDWLDARR
ncbi:hypothetical protein K2Z83_20880 [Oscillochloris sp. ZM17-4]|uniref:hypothetical protein n=1 Tax=Oscillochloris sp. ZM17-4 TaxID=2866714 RepID=UPI001C7325A1|nr:hypothetical protein [Oscillochloris sp. ZM17-4]MBX0330127.1 hypothetical protein [Oscillochloris sp. ZM17-4]